MTPKITYCIEHRDNEEKWARFSCYHFNSLEDAESEMQAILKRIYENKLELSHKEYRIVEVTVQQKTIEHYSPKEHQKYISAVNDELHFWNQIHKNLTTLEYLYQHGRLADENMLSGVKGSLDRVQNRLDSIKKKLEKIS